MPNKSSSTTQKTIHKQGRLIHIAKAIFQRGARCYLLLREEPAAFRWFIEQGKKHEQPTEVAAPTIEEAIRLAHRFWGGQDFFTVHCGYRFSLPGRDEIGTNALFYQMIASYSSFNGQYLDEDLGYLCIVCEISQEARALWHRLRDQDRL